MLLRTFICFLLMLQLIYSYKFLSMCTHENHATAPNKTKCNETCNANQTEFEVIDVDAMDRICINHLNESRKIGYCSGFKYVHNPYADQVRRKDMLPMCVKCALCQAIAQQAREIFDSLNDEGKHMEPCIIKQKVHERFNHNFCAHSFCNHDLRNYDKRSVIARCDCGTHIRTQYDGNWPKLLKDMCNTFVNQLDPNEKYNIYMQYKVDKKPVEDYLCRGYGVFRECTNLLNPPPILHENDTRKFWGDCFF